MIMFFRLRIKIIETKDFFFDLSQKTFIQIVFYRCRSLCNPLAKQFRQAQYGIVNKIWLSEKGLFADAEIRKDIAQQLIVGNLTSNLTQVI